MMEFNKVNYRSKVEWVLNFKESLQYLADILINKVRFMVLQLLQNLNR